MFVADAAGHARPVEMFDQGAGVFPRNLEPLFEIDDGDLAPLPQDVERSLARLLQKVAVIRDLRVEPDEPALLEKGVHHAFEDALVQAGRAVIHRVLDGSDEATIGLIEEVAAAVTGVEHVTEARARWTGHQLRAELNIVVDSRLTVGDGHAIADRAREELLSHVPRLAEATVHVDPHEHDGHVATPPAGGSSPPE